jgi:DNA-directed RNA polymerase subunit RPC12/RpoP
MRYLSETMSVYFCAECSVRVLEPEVRVDGYGENCCPRCDSELERAEEQRRAEYWSVAVYAVDRAYGGPEEGGWWYDCGDLSEHAMIRVFDDIAEARAYMELLWSEVPDDERRGEIRTVVCGYTHSLPEHHWPRVRPRYC